MKSITCIIETTNQKNEKCLYVGRNSVAWLPPHPVPTEKFSSCVYRKVFFWEFSSIIPFMVWP